eukprot:scpid74363/ scgid17979/ 
MARPRWTIRRLSVLTLLLSVWSGASQKLVTALLDENIHGADARQADLPKTILVFAQDSEDHSSWHFIAVDLWSHAAGRHVLTVKRDEQSFVACGYALVEPDLVVFYGVERSVEIWNLTSGKESAKFESTGYPLYTIGFNPSSRHIEGVCQVQVPMQNFTQTSWCYLGDEGDPRLIHRIDDSLLGQVRSACVTHIDSESGSTVWFPTFMYRQQEVNWYFVGQSTAANTSADSTTWIGAINGSLQGHDSYFHDATLNRSFAIQLSPDNATSQLVEITPAEHADPERRNDPPPTLLFVFPGNAMLCSAGTAVYDLVTHTVFALMQRRLKAASDAAEHNASDTPWSEPYLARLNIMTLQLYAQPISWPPSTKRPLPKSVRLWQPMPGL